MFPNPSHPIVDSIQGKGYSSPRPISSPETSEVCSASWIKTTLWTTVFAALLLAGLAAYGVSQLRSVGALVAALQGRVLYVEPGRIPVGILKPREHVTVGIRLRNLAADPIKVLGSHSSCGCLVADELPVELAPGEVKEVSIHLTAPTGGPAEFETIVVFYTNAVGEQPQVVLHGRVLPADTGNDSPRNAG